MEGNVPIFIQTGAEVLSSLCSSEDLAITPELLRLVRVGEASKQHVKQVLIYFFAIIAATF
jgi:hypothetical protein